MARRVKIKLQDTVPPRVISLDPAATEGAILDTNLFMPDGTIGTPETVRKWLGVSSSGVVVPTGGVNHHRLLQGLPIGDDHPQYTRKDTLTTQGDMYVRGASTVQRLAGGAAGQILTTPGPSAAPVWRYPESGRTHSEIFDDFMYVYNATAVNGWDVNVGGSAVTGTAGGAGHPGVVRLPTTTSGSSYAGIIRALLGPPVSGIEVGGGEITVDWIFRFPTAIPTPTDIAIALLGLVDEVNTNGMRAGIFITTAFDGATWRFIGATINSGSLTLVPDATTVVASGVAVAADTWYHGRIVINAAGTSVEYFIDGVSLGSISTFIPSAVVVPGAKYRRAGVLGTAFILDVDACRMIQVFTTPRWSA